MTDCANELRHQDQPEPAAGHGRLCHRCTTGLARDLERLPGLYAGLGDILDPHGGGPGDGDGDGLPFSEPVSGCMSQIRHDLAWWLLEVAGSARAAPPADLRVPALAGWLHAQVTWVIFRPWAGDMAGAMAADRSWAMSLLDPMPRSRIPIPPDLNRCPACGITGRLTAAVSLSPADRRPSLVGCGACGEEWEPVQWLKLGRRILAWRDTAKGAA